MNVSRTFPLELIFQVIDNVVGDPHVILRPSHPITRTLLSLASVCRATYPVASNYLRQHCVYIDNDRRLRGLIQCLELTSDWTQGTLLESHGGADVTDIPPSTHRLPGAPLCPITTLYLAPYANTLDDQPNAIWIRELFCLIHPTLRRLIVDLPLRSLYPADDHLNVRKTLRDAFSLLTNLEEFVSVRDELFLDVLERAWRRPDEASEAPVWTLWHELKRLALYNVNADERFWADVQGMRELETVILTRANGLQETCLKSAYLAAARVGGANADTDTDGSGFELGGADADTDTEGSDFDLGGAETPEAPPPRPLKVVLVNVSSQHPESVAGQFKWAFVDPDDMISVRIYDVPVPFYGDDDDIELCQGWVKTAALSRELWNWEGTLISAAIFMDFANPVATSDVLNDFDFDSFLVDD